MGRRSQRCALNGEQVSRRHISDIEANLPTFDISPYHFIIFSLPSLVYKEGGKGAFELEAALLLSWLRAVNPYGFRTSPAVDSMMMACVHDSQPDLTLSTILYHKPREVPE